MASRDSDRPRSQKLLPQGLSVMPNSLTDVETTNSVIFQITLINTTAGGVTVLVQDKQATPKVLVPTSTVPANSVSILAFPEGVLMTSGFSHQAGAASSITVEYYGYFI